LKYLYVQRADSYQKLSVISLLCVLLVALAGCGGSNTSASSSAPLPAAKQILTFPNVGTTDLSVLDPAMDPDTSSLLAINMLYSGLVRTNQNLQVVPDQATWQISTDQKVYTFKLLPYIKFSDGTPVTAQTYVYSWTRALLPSIGSDDALFLESPIVGASAVNSGKATTLAGVKALDNYTLQVTLTQPTPYFLAELANPLFYPVNQKLIVRYGEKNWTQHVIGSGVGTGPFIVQQWEHNVKMLFAPNPYYYGHKTRLTAVNMYFVNDPGIAYETYRANEGDFVWGLDQGDQEGATGTRGFVQVPLLQTDALFFNATMPPFNNAAIRQAFAYAIDKLGLVSTIFKDTVVPASTIVPPGMSGYQPDYTGITLDKKKARELLQSVYPDPNAVPPITFSYPTSQVSAQEAELLQYMWKVGLGVQVQLRAIEPTAYNDEMQNHLIQLGFVNWTADYADPYDCLALNLLSTANNNVGEWSNQQFDQDIMQAEQLEGNARLALYDKAEQIAISDAAWVPLYYPTMAAIIPSWVHGVTLNGEGLYFGDWSGVYVSAR
jgi:oligopeptide transport system substrate-binding protein